MITSTSRCWDALRSDFRHADAYREHPESNVYGAEWDATWRVTRGLTADVTGVLQKSTITDYINYNEFSQLENFKGKSFALDAGACS